jgi:hypothetical protein
MIFKNKEAREMSAMITESGLEFRKGTVSGYSIEIEESDPQSFTSFTYYEDESGRDADFDLLTQLRFNHVTS